MGNPWEILNWLMIFRPSERRRLERLEQRKRLQETLQSLAYRVQEEESYSLPVAFLCRLRNYDYETFWPLFVERADRLDQITEHVYSRFRDRGRAFKRAEWLFLEAVRDAL